MGEYSNCPDLTGYSKCPKCGRWLCVCRVAPDVVARHDAARLTRVAIAGADEFLSNIRGLPSYTTLLGLVEEFIDEVRAGPAQVIGYSTGGANQQAFDFGWYSNAERMWQRSEALRAVIHMVKEAKE